MFFASIKHAPYSTRHAPRHVIVSAWRAPPSSPDESTRSAAASALAQNLTESGFCIDRCSFGDSDVRRAAFFDLQRRHEQRDPVATHDQVAEWIAGAGQAFPPAKGELTQVIRGYLIGGL